MCPPDKTSQSLERASFQGFFVSNKVFFYFLLMDTRRTKETKAEKDHGGG